MKQGIHPNWHDDAVVTCVCGNTFTTGSIQETLQVDICSKCHPFFTGEMRFVDRQGRVDKFMQKMQKAQQIKQTDGKKTKGKAAVPAEDAKSYQEILRDQQTRLRKSQTAA
jgi:large subunit ribosomal protein L31